MNTLVKKEIRLLLPAFVGALALAIVPIWLARYDPWNRDAWPALWSACLFLFGTVLLALSSYGREIGLRTLPFILAQPLERARIWRTKIAVLAVSLAVVFDAWLISGSLRAFVRPELVAPPDELAAFGIFAVVFTAGGLWLTLLLRQTMAAFWLTLLIPASAITAIKGCGGADWMMYAVLGVYGVAGFFLARRQFLVVQDTAWTGGVIVLGGRAAAERSALRERRPWAALFWKEIQLQQITLLGMAGLLLLHIGVVAVRQAGAHTFSRTTLMGLEAFGSLWFLVPLLAGSQSVAEERKFGTMQAHLCLPIPRRAQCFLKLMVVLVIGLLSWMLYWTVQFTAGISDGSHELIPTFLLSLLLALAGFYGSTLTGGVVQALAASALTLLGLCLSVFLPYMPMPGSRSQYKQLCTGDLPPFIGWPLLVSAVLWLAYRNFGNAVESWPLWRRNVLTLAGMAALSFALTLGVYHRAWEWLTPLEPPPGPARLSVEKPPALYSYGGRGLAALMPDGRLWVDRLGRGPAWRVRPLILAYAASFFVDRSFRGPDWRVQDLTVGEKWMSLGGHEFVSGSNWVDAVANSRETVAIRADGTLWVSAKPRPIWYDNGVPPVEPSTGLIQFGQDTHWLNVARFPEWSVLLLKRDGTLWAWGTNSFNEKREQPSLRDFQPRRLGQDSDWAKLQRSDGWVYAFLWKTDGSAWILHYPASGRRMFSEEFRNPAPQEFERGICLSRMPGMDHTRWRSLRSAGNAVFYGVREDGTLWCWDARPRGLKLPSEKAAVSGENALVQIGRDADWAELAATGNRVVARKNDGSLWKWEWSWPNMYSWQPFDAMREPPVRLGTHSDWVALAVVGPNILSLAADGSLWGWPTPEPEAVFGDGSSLYLAASRKPAKIENILGVK